MGLRPEDECDVDVICGCDRHTYWTCQAGWRCCYRGAIDNI